MAVPRFHVFLLPVLRHISDGATHRPADTVDFVISQFPFTEADLNDRLPNGRTRIMDRTLWAITYLRKAKLLESVSFGVFRITERGLSLLAENPQSITLKDLERYPEYLEFKGKVTQSRSSESETSDSAESVTSPEEQLYSAYRSMRSVLEQELLERIKHSSPSFFERLVVRLLVAMGYGGSLEDAGHATKQTGDDGIDGIVKEDRLGLDVIHIQAKRWLDKQVGRPDIQNFAGSLEGQRGKKGVYITTSSFTSGAREYVSRIEKKIVLIDGPELSRLCVEFNIGVASDITYTVKKLSEEFFEDA